MRRILVADDDPGIRQLIEAMLAPDEFEIVFASSGTEALERGRNGAPDVILLDVMMPGMDGLEVCRELKEDPRTSAIPVIILTGRGEFEYRVRGEEAHADAYLTKPFSPFNLLRLIDHLLDVSGKRQQPT